MLRSALLLLFVFSTFSSNAQHWTLGSHNGGITSVVHVPSTHSFVIVGNTCILHAYDDRTGAPIADLMAQMPVTPSYFMPILASRSDSALVMVITPQRIAAVQADLSAMAWTLDVEPGIIQDLGQAICVTDTMIYQDQLVSTMMLDLRTGTHTSVPVSGVPQPALGSSVRVWADTIMRFRYDDGAAIDTLVLPRSVKAYDVSDNGLHIAVATDDKTYIVAGDSLHVIDSIAVANYFGESVVLSPSAMRVINGRGVLWDRQRGTKISLDNDDAAPSSDLLSHVAWSATEDVAACVSKLPCNDGSACKGGWMTLYRTSSGTIIANPVGTAGASFDVSITTDGAHTVLASTGLVSVRSVVDAHVILNRWPSSTLMFGGATSPSASYGMYIQYDDALGSTSPYEITTLLASNPSLATIDDSIPAHTTLTLPDITRRITFTANGQFLVDAFTGTLRVVDITTGTQRGLSERADGVIALSASLVALYAEQTSSVTVVDCTSLQIIASFMLNERIDTIAAVRGTSWICATTPTSCYLYDVAKKVFVDTVPRPTTGSGAAPVSKRFLRNTAVYVDVVPVTAGDHVANQLVAIDLRTGAIVRRGDTIHTGVADLCTSLNGFAVVAVAPDGRVTSLPGFTDVDTIAVDTTTSAIAGEPNSADLDPHLALVHGRLIITPVNDAVVDVEIIDMLGRRLAAFTGPRIEADLSRLGVRACYVRITNVNGSTPRTWTRAIIVP